MKSRIRSMPRLWHVGDMLVASKRRNSYEGTGLSVSVHPAAWRMIARGQVGGDTWLLEKPGARFLDALSLSQAQKNKVLAWGHRQGYVAAADLWKWTYWDDELEEELHQIFPTREEAIAEADVDEEGDDFDSDCITAIAGHVSTPALDRETLQDRPSHGTASVLDLLLPLYADQVLEIDGVWWSERLDPLAFSAPRGVIAPRRVSEWMASLCDQDPDADEY